ncbi:MAG: hypothetical protein AVDCRST_MAG52-927 [uncultured Blastococcus sp.]|uniref:Uncharacterized protein n=1 Tax=uncultured Blastococcus sp. TaxID=217144 RepID=A0A6J4HQM9_9ACTN|nr:MAG: hypothetical protein AVDCRST_MAG52-927 [uncultured Blastococcus sp.]
MSRRALPVAVAAAARVSGSGAGRLFRGHYVDAAIEKVTPVVGED